MRSVLSISLPEEKKKELQERARKINKTTSEYFLYIMELEKSLISEDELLLMSKNAKKDYKLGKTKKLASLKSLIK